MAGQGSLSPGGGSVRRREGEREGEGRGGGEGSGRIGIYVRKKHNAMLPAIILYIIWCMRAAVPHT